MQGGARARVKSGKSQAWSSWQYPTLLLALASIPIHVTAPTHKHLGQIERHSPGRNPRHLHLVPALPRPLHATWRLGYEHRQRSRRALRRRRPCRLSWRHPCALRATAPPHKRMRYGTNCPLPEHSHNGMHTMHISKTGYRAPDARGTGTLQRWNIYTDAYGGEGGLVRRQRDKRALNLDALESTR